MTLISNFTASSIKDAARSLHNGNLVAFPTETVYGLGADAQNNDAVIKIYQAKGRPSNHPLIVHLSSIKYLDKWARDIPDYAMVLAETFWPGPLTIILPRTKLAKDCITGGQDNVGLRIPSHTVALALLKEFELQGGLGVAAPSANRFGAVSPTSADAVRTELGKYLSDSDRILDGGQCMVGIESTILNCTQIPPTILRPGGVTKEAIQEVLGIKINSDRVSTSNVKIKAPGLLETHYAPNARVFITGSPKPGDGFIALDIIPTPPGAIRLANPVNNEEYAKVLYQALRLADAKNLDRVFAVPPMGNNLEVAIRDRLQKCATKV